MPRMIASWTLFSFYDKEGVAVFLLFIGASFLPRLLLPTNLSSGYDNRAQMSPATLKWA